MKKEITIQWLDTGEIENVIVKIGDVLTIGEWDNDDDDIFFYFEDEGEMEDFKVEGIEEFIIIES
jgi:hypothetical protein